MRGTVARLIVLSMLFAGLPVQMACKTHFGSRSHSATLTWKAPAATPGVTIVGYNVYRSSAPGAAYTIVATRVPNPTYTDKGLESGKVYYYVVTSIDQAGHESKRSDEIVVKVP